MRRSRGRPSKLTVAAQDTILKMLRLGSTYDLAAKAAGIHPSTFWKWIEEGRSAKAGRFREFFESVQRVEAEAAAALLARIQKAAQGGDWRAAAWILRNRHPDQFNERLDVRGRIEHDHRVQVDPEQRQAALEVLQRAGLIASTRGLPDQCLNGRTGGA